MAYSKNSFLKNAPNKSFYTGLNYNNLPVIKQSISDTSITLTEKYNMRPDLLSYDLYGTVDFWWVFSLRNVDIIKDPINDFKPGVSIKAPSPATIELLARN
jgi:hypothetical protein|tara:strand:+ start:2813 stop:3115 length:303 start_codon:yes stop_codon:yes gene_type:complete